MPIFHDPDHPRSPEHSSYAAPAPPASAETVRTEFPASTFLELLPPINPGASSRHHGLGIFGANETATIDRMELIQRIKRGQSPTWTAGPPAVGSLETHTSTPVQEDQTLGGSKQVRELGGDRLSGIPSREVENCADARSQAAGIERPRSALHSGDFTQGRNIEQTPQARAPSAAYDDFSRPHPGIGGISPTATWYHSPPSISSFHSLPRSPVEFSDTRGLNAVRQRAPSLASSSSFVLRAPTSPLVHASSNSDLDAPRNHAVDIPRARSGSPQPYTLSSSSLQSMPHAYHTPSASESRRPSPMMRREPTFPYQAHQPRRSISSAFPNSSSYSSRSPSQGGSRRTSLSSDIPPLHHAPMVGSYEESILKGRMSTTPSKPLNFTAQIGVLARGKCKPSLRCPPHVTVPFPAVFYSYSTGRGRPGTEEEPSPYVGLVDLENSLPQYQEKNKNRRRKEPADEADDDAADGDHFCDLEPEGTNTVPEFERQRRTGQSIGVPKSPAGGSYRIPQKGQLQIVIKNPNKTAVKLFLIPYDLEGMEPGMKTFIRQRSYSAGPILEVPADTRSNSDRHPSAAPATAQTEDRRVLRYLIHLHICSPARGRYFLYKSIRVVFANRVPDEKEKLHNEIQLPNPRYSVYKPSTEASSGVTTPLGASALTADKAWRRRSAGWTPGHSSAQLPDFADNPSPPPTFDRSYGYGTSIGGVPFRLPKQQVVSREMIDDSLTNRKDADEFRFTAELAGQPALSENAMLPTNNEGAYEKLSKGDIGYGGRVSPFNRSLEAEEGLLAKKLRGLDLQKDNSGGDQI